MTAAAVREAVDKARRVMPKPANGHDLEAPPMFVEVPVADLAAVELEPLHYWWADYLPPAAVTVLGAHGGIGKSVIALMLAVHIATGRALFGVPTRRGRVVFYSAEDSADLVRRRLKLILRVMGLDSAELVGWLHVLDATAGDPVLFHEVGNGARRLGATTPVHDALVEYFERAEGDVLIIDNASDTFDANEVVRALVGGFMRALARIVRPRGGAVLLIAHVDKASARGTASGSDSYSGSTAWHNRARSRLALTRDRDGLLTLEHQKHNLGRMRPPLTLEWPEDELPRPVRPAEPFVQHLADRADARALLTLIHEFYRRAEYIAPATTSPANAARVLSSQRGYPRRKPAEVFELLRDAERRGLIVREGYKTADRKARERWALTAPGLELVGALPLQGAEG